MSYGCDAASNVLTFRNRGNETTGFSYDDLGQMTPKDAPGTEPTSATATTCSAG